MHILIVEDDLNIANLFAKLLEKQKFTSDIIDNVTEAVNFLQNNSPDIMILDYVLKNEYATEILDRCHHENITIPPFIVATGREETSLAVEMMKRGARDFLVKDSHFLELFPSVIHRLKNEIINERKYHETREHLKAITNLHLQVFESLDEAVALVDCDLTILLFNNKAAQLCKKFDVCDDIIGKRIDLAIPFLPKELLNNYAIVLKHKKTIQYLGKYEIDNEPIMIEFRQIPYFDEEILKGVITIAKDVTTAELVKQEIKEKQLLLEETQKLSKIGGWKFDVSKKKMIWTHETFQLHGLSPDQYIQKGDEYIDTSIKCYPDEYKSLVMEHFNNCRENGIPYDLEVPFIKFSGEEIRIRTVGRAIKEDGKIVQVLGNIMDVTDIYEAREKIEKSKQSYEDIFNSVSEAINIHDVNGKLIDINLGAEKMMLYSREELLSKKLQDIADKRMNNIPEIERLFRHTFETGEPSHFEFWVRKKNGNVFPKDVIVNRGKYFGNTVLISVAWDITKRKLEEDIQRAELDMIEYSSNHHINDVLRKFLDETEQLTQSKIGFYHFMENDQVTIAIQTWSTRTMNKFCNVPEFLTHYPITNAGVWVDCVREKQPVIHNDYASLPHKKGLPEGHAPIIRELVVPVFRNKRIVAILGVGNKETNYDEIDINTVQHFADLAWETVEKKRYQEELIKSEHRLRTIIDAVPSMIYVKNREGRFLAANQAVADSLNVELKDVIGNLHSDLHQNKEELEMMLQSDMQVFETGEPVAIMDEYLHDNEGNHYWSHTIKVPYEGDDFNEPAILGVTVDITRIKEVEESIRKSERKFRTLVQNIPGITYRCLNDENWTMVYFSDKSGEILGYSAVDFVNNNVRSYESIIHPDDKEHVRIRVDKAIESNTTYNMEYRVICGNGSIKWVLEKGQGIKDQDGNLLYLDGFIMDISERKRTEEERDKLEEKLRRAQKLETIGTLAGGIAHDFNNMLTPIMGYSDLALTKIPTFNPLHDDLENILQAAKRAKDLVQQILMFSRQIETEHQPLKLHLIVKEAVKLLRPSIPSIINIKLELDKESSYINADPAQIHQVIVNLCTNSFHAMEETGGVLKIKLQDIDIDEITAEVYDNLNTGKYVKLTIQDTGGGMDNLTMNRIFEPFFTTKPVDKGTGMGLSVVHGIIKNHNGDIIVYSEPGQGTAFNVYFPAIENPNIDDASAKASIIRGNGNILVLDDEEFITKMSKKMLEEAGYKVDAINSSREALKIITEDPQKYDLLITDLTMPEITGTNLAKSIRHQNIEIPILLMTGYGDLISEELIEQSKINRVISKPIIFHDFALAVKEILDSTSK